MNTAIPTDIGWVGVAAGDLRSASKWFREQLDFALAMEMPELGIEIFQLPSGQQFEIMAQDAPGAQLFQRPVLGFEVDDVNAARAELERRGLAFTGETVDTGGFAWAFFNDGRGTTHEIVKCPPRRDDLDASGGELGVQSILWAGATVDDLVAETSRFDKLGFPKIDTGPDLPLTLYQMPSGRTFELMADGLPGSEFGGYPMIGFHVDDLDAAEKLLRARGAGVIGRAEVPGLRWIYVQGPDEVVYEIITPTGPNP